MKTKVILSVLLIGVGCSGKKKAEAPVDNTMTRYVEGLQADVRKADEVADKANALIKKQEADLQAVSNQP